MPVVGVFGERPIGRLRRQYSKDLLRQEMTFYDRLSAKKVAACEY